MKKILFLSIIMLGFCVTKTWAQVNVTVNKPEETAIDEFNVTGNNGKKFVIKVPVAKGASAETKAKELQRALLGQSIPSTVTGATVSIPDAKSIELTGDNSKQGGSASRPGQAIKKQVVLKM